MVDISELKQLIALMNENDLVEIEVTSETGRKVRLRKNHEEPANRMVAVMPGFSPGAPAAAPAPAERKAEEDKNLALISSPMVGTFYRSPGPDADPYVNAGDRVTGETVVCIIEAMKVMNEIKAEIEGEVVEVLVENGEPVE
ncbi:MAG: acetyl-CoA carboxylase biotin carboxyl carrier protein, partial [Planctomycetes bacterium]|nr:acetyl-CoA carboxylase biotin carboxyl carrier protein [Planctomycetota bacterium]